MTTLVQRPAAMAAAIGIAAGAAYTLSPLTVVVALAVVPLFRWAVKEIPQPERRWLVGILALGLATRLLVIGALFLSSNHDVVPFRTFFGDEEYFLRRSIWLRNFALHIPIHRADFLYAFDPRGRTSYVYLLAALQVLVGPAPYGAHLVSVWCYMAAAVILFRLARPAFGPIAALAGLALLLFLPSLFTWSISVLKEPLYTLVLTISVAAAVTAGRLRSPATTAGALALVLVCGYAAQTLRDGGLMTAGVAGLGGFAAGVAATRPRTAVATVLAAIVAGALLLTRGSVQDRIVFSVRHAASMHWENVNTPGYVYTILDGDFYGDRRAIDDMTLRQGARYIVMALVRYATVPVPWNIQSRAALAYLPEQVVWYVLILLLPVGFVSALKRDAMLTCVLSAYVVAAVVVVALTSGNVGTLVRHRGLAVPYLIWFSALGASRLLARPFFPQDAHVDHR